MIKFDNTYSRLPEGFHQAIHSPNTLKPSLIAFNEELSKQLGLEINSDPDMLARYFSATEFMPGSSPIAMAYAGHQFGHFVPQLGDGRAMLLGEFLSSDKKRYDVHLKGSGRTFYSRRGDGKSVIGPVLREYLVSEGMYALQIPTTRSLCAVRTGEMVQREELLPGAVLTRIALSHIRVGTFEFFARQGDTVNLKILADYSIARLYPEIKDLPEQYFEFWKRVCSRQMDLIVKWMSVGFIHGVMNTDNMSISGETIDYGPCAFMDEFKFNKVFSSIDQHGRYAYSNQPTIALWNLARLAECLIQIIEKPKEELGEIFSAELQKSHEYFLKEYQVSMVSKFGLSKPGEDLDLIQTWFSFLEQNGLDFTLSFIDLERVIGQQKTFTGIENVAGFDVFLTKWKQRLDQEKRSDQDILSQLTRTNPLTIPRNHQIEKVIQASQQGDDSEFFKLLEVIKKPFERLDVLTPYQLPPKPQERIERTFCGT